MTPRARMNHHCNAPKRHEFLVNEKRLQRPHFRLAPNSQPRLRRRFRPTERSTESSTTLVGVRVKTYETHTVEDGEDAKRRTEDDT